ncbi:hypothetical protein BCR41DRAFT_397838 [Lobosporangium transversale]|uniref:Uncharacterized protein n=1 Tax=Lobosporangium transversale TaxID=64571 RepID=A0A1Y2GHE3_9FUNG|nr:hypothetical protein BCR41DRAFT_398174 [Lobosporangium transversale]XP_021879783.1 hypothetical protein BCR41DRAFT_397838 [Lobosporangium transversale]ORZ11008.1 hypothetical protein BCR41DRAFT_398174 [Lobosporangium transversale]ORZ11686.1 hypothetical protein BCR41DRAFT_397838 [Lobosporangium transversale]|eukprot:XP_021879525.1 hypothetical protein BCR41DRAFT_398174 [Lobosporangium transversale]
MLLTPTHQLEKMKTGVKRRVENEVDRAETNHETITAKRLKTQLISARAEEGGENEYTDRMCRWLEEICEDVPEEVKQKLAHYVSKSEQTNDETESLLGTINQLTFKKQAPSVTELLPSITARTTIHTAHTYILAASLLAIEMMLQPSQNPENTLFEPVGHSNAVVKTLIMIKRN